MTQARQEPDQIPSQRKVPKLITLTDMEALWFGTMAHEWNCLEINRITSTMKNIKTVVDIGACAGFSVNHYVKMLKPDKIIAFEPEKRNFEIMESMVRESTTTDITLKNVGIYYGLNECKVIHCNDGNPGGRSMEIFASNIDEEKDVQVLDDSVYSLTPLEKEIDFIPDLIKIDVEGAEYNIIENSSIVKQAKYLFIEWHNKTNRDIITFMVENLPDHKMVIRDSRNSILLERQ